MIVGNLFKILLFFYLFNMNVSFLYTKQDRLRVQLSKFNKFVVIGKNECCDIINTWKQENIEDKEYRIMLDKGIRQICDNTAFPLFVNRTNAQYMIINLVSEENVNIINILDNKNNTWHIDKAIMEYHVFLVEQNYNEVDMKQISSGFKLVTDYLEKSVLKPNNILQPKSRIEFLNQLKE